MILSLNLILDDAVKLHLSKWEANHILFNSF